ncbi:MAG: T9SS type A sorting domain-containing protein, partial [Bacteroidota bacterium]|nr:T9SS type A sorting domain-containing protein [Bacteroidota bacterium]
GGRLVLENITYENSSSPIFVPRGVVIATKAVTAPESKFDAKRGAFVTYVPVGFSSTADIFITGVIINSKTGFKKDKNGGSVLSGIFRSNVAYNGQWNYAMAAYSATATSDYIQYQQLAGDKSIVAISNSTYKAGTPMPWIGRITIGGTGNGGSNYTGSPSNYDNLSSCIITTPAKPTYFTAVEPTEKAVQAVLLSGGDLQVYPNPARGNVTLAFLPKRTGNATVQVYNASGTRVLNVYRGTAEANRLFTRKIDTQQWAAGVYIIQVVMNDRVINRKLVISP